MRRLMCGALLILVGAIFTAPAAAATKMVDVGPAELFSPARIAIKPGDTVMWTTQGTSEVHNTRFEDESVGRPPAPQLSFTVSRTFTAVGRYPYYCMEHGAPGGQGMSGVVYVTASGELPPVAQFSVSPNPLVAGQTATFDARASRASNTTISTYEWDLDGNGTYELNTGTTPTASKVYDAASPGLNVKLKVTDGRGDTDERTQEVVIQTPPPVVTPPPPVVTPPPPAVTPPPPVVTPPPGGTPRDVLAPGVSGYRLLRARFAVAAKSSKRRPAGTTFTYRLSEAASVKIVIVQQRPRKRVVGTLRRQSPKGAGRIAFSGRLGGRSLKSGGYQATLTATDAAGNTSKPKTVTFTVVKGKR